MLQKKVLFIVLVQIHFIHQKQLNETNVTSRVSPSYKFEVFS